MEGPDYDQMDRIYLSSTGCLFVIYSKPKYTTLGLAFFYGILGDMGLCRREGRGHRQDIDGNLLYNPSNSWYTQLVAVKRRTICGLISQQN